MHFATVVCVEICLLCLIHLHTRACQHCNRIHTRIHFTTQSMAHTHTHQHHPPPPHPPTHMQGKAICHSFVQSSSLSQCLWQQAREVASVVVGQSPTRGDDSNREVVTINV